MEYNQFEETGSLSEMIKWFWSVRSADTTSNIQKIIPDGYPELIFHFGDPYESDIDGVWKLQSRELLAGQLSGHFQLRNTGESDMFAIKFQPWAITEIFGFEMSSITDKVVPLPENISQALLDVWNIAGSSKTFDEKVDGIRDVFEQMRRTVNSTRLAVQEMLNRNGDMSIVEMASISGVSKRTLERYFHRFIGISPKKYSRVIRLAHIFKLVQEEHANWAEIAYKGGYYDQSHFIKEFKEFTGEDVSSYGYDEATMANFFLK